MDAARQAVVLITGASSGIGKACAEHLSGRGYRVYGTSRNALELSRPPETAKAARPPFELIRMDVTSDESVQQGIKQVLDREGRIDILVNNAGIGIAGAVEETEIREARAQMETNFFGVVQMCRAVLPLMRQQGGGYLINISSIGGLIGIPFQALYSASKFAIEGFTEALRAEVRPYGIRVALIEPGDFRTGFTAHRCKTAAAREGTIYWTRFARALGVMEADETAGAAPERIAHLLEQIIRTHSPRPRYTVGPITQRMAVGLKKVMPSKIFEWAIMKYYKL